MLRPAALGARDNAREVGKHLRGPPLATVANARMKSRNKAVRQTETFEEALASSAIDETQKAEWREALSAKGCMPSNEHVERD